MHKTKGNKKLIWLIIGLLGLPLWGNTQPYFFEQLPSHIGLTQSAITAIHQDSDGYLWIGTWYGLARYDGYHIKLFQYHPNEPNSLSNNKINLIFEDSKHRLWVGTESGGLLLYDNRLEHFKRYQYQQGATDRLSNNQILSMIEDQRDGTLWIGTDFGLNHFNPDTEKFQVYLKEPEYANSLADNHIRALYQEDNGTIWVGTKEGISILNKKGKTTQFSSFAVHPEGAAEAHLHNFIYKIIEHQGDIWVGSNAGLKKIESKNIGRIKHYEYKESKANSLSNNFISTILPMATGSDTLLIGTGDGLNILNTKTNKFSVLQSKTQATSQLNNQYILSLFKDNAGILWVGTNEGLYKLVESPFMNIKIAAASTSNYNDFTYMSQSKQQKNVLWVGTMGGGLNKITFDKDYETYTTTTYKIANQAVNQFTNFIYSVYADHEGCLWVGTRGAGLLCIKESEIPTTSSIISKYQQFSAINDSVLDEDYIMVTEESVNGGLWLGGWDKGAFKLNKKTGAIRHFSIDKNAQSNGVQFPIIFFKEEILERDTFLWVVSRGSGVHQFTYYPSTSRLEPLRHFNEKNGLTSDFCNLIYMDEEGEKLVGGERGITVLKNGKIVDVINKEDGLKHDLIQNIIKDEVGRYWVSTNQGISSFRYDDGVVTAVQNYDTRNGLMEEFFHSSSGTSLAGNHLIFGGVNGATLFNPDKISTNTISPRAVLADFKLFNKSVEIGEEVSKKVLLSSSINTTEQIQLRHSDNVFTITFSGLHFTHPEKNTYAYRLDGFDKNWIYTDATHRTAHYTNLSHGNYTFRVKAANADGIWGEEKILSIKILPPFWLTWWAYLIYLALFVGILYGVRALTLMRVNFNNKLELERLEREKLEEVNQMKLQFYTDVSHDLRTPLTLLLSPLEDILKNAKVDFNTKNSLLLMHKNATRLMRMINQLLDFRKDDAHKTQLAVAEHDFVDFADEIVMAFKELAQQRGIELRFDAYIENLPLWFDDEHFEKVIYNLLSNAFKFTPDGGRIAVNITENETQAILVVSDTGEGIAPEELPHVFDRFYSVKKKNKHTHGTGIGLALAKRVVENHHGTISVKSKLQEGTAFTIKLQKGKKHFKKDQFQKEQTQQTPAFVPITQIEETTHPTTDTAHRYTILIVEDNTDIRAYLKLKLQDSYHIVEANNGVQGLEEATAKLPDLVISDISMPEMDGIEFCRQLKSNLQTSHIPIILLTARTSLVYQLSGLETGADDYVTKPFNMEVLASRITNLLQSRQLLKKHYAKNMLLKPSDIVVNSLDEEFLKNTIKLIEEHIDDSSYSIELLSKDLHMSRMNFYRKIKALTNTTPNAFIRKIKMQRAAQLLKSKQYTVTEVTYKVGFSDLKYFRQKFKEEYGVSPSAYE